MDSQSNAGFDHNQGSRLKSTEGACEDSCVRRLWAASYPAVAANGLLALLAGVGVQALVAFHTVGVLLSQNVLLPKQGLLTVVAVIALGHFDPESPY